MVRVSVVVPVYNPGEHIGPLLDSLLGQTLPADECELVFVDDGSTDGTAERLAALAAVHPHVRLAHVPRSGWPGRPRNVGLEMARGEYVFFADHDDRLGVEALERLCGMAVADDADVVIGKVVGHRKGVPRDVFRANRHGIAPHEAPFSLPSPHIRMAGETLKRLKVSVVVPVYNPGRDIEPLIDSLLAQTMAPADREFVFVDDGSTDGTGARLDHLAAEHYDVRVVHIPNSGWPGRPRNIGIEEASGEYVFFADNDDWLADDALERLYACAVEHRADIVIGKVVGHGRHIPHMFTKDQHGLDATGAPLALLTPHKLFRTAMLRKHGIRFPEGRRRLEDHLFVVPAYFAAERISVLASHSIYHWVRRNPDRGASRQRPDVEAHFESIRELLTIVDTRTSLGEVRDRYYLHWYRVKVLKRLGRATGHQTDSAYRAEFFDHATRLIRERIPVRLDELLPFNFRLRALLARRGDLRGLERLRAFESDVRTFARVDAVGAHVRVTGELRARGNPAIRVARVNGRLLWEPPEELHGLWDESEREMTSGFEPRLRIVLRSRQDAGDWVYRAHPLVDLPHGAIVPAKLHAELDLGAALAVAHAMPPAGVYGVRLAMSLAGFLHEAPVRVDGGEHFTITVTPEGHPRASHRSAKTGTATTGAATSGTASSSDRRRLRHLIARAARPLRRG